MKNKFNIIKLLSFTICAVLLTFCTSEVDFGEQFKKTVYIVNSNDLLYNESKHFYGEQNKMVFSVYCASSEPLRHDISAQLIIDLQVLDSLNTSRLKGDPNFITRKLLPESNYSLPSSLSVNIKSGEQYGILEIPFNTNDLNPFEIYTLPVTLKSNSENYDINPLLKSIVYEIVMENEYSGNYAGISSESETVARTVQPALKALDINKVLMPIHNLSDDLKNIDSNFMILTIGTDGRSVSIEPHENSQVIDLGGSNYDREQQKFELHYQFTDSNKEFEITEIITNINSPILEEDDDVFL